MRYILDGIESSDLNIIIEHIKKNFPFLVVCHKDKLQEAFDKSEDETARQFENRSCTIKDKDGKDSCPICFFRGKVKEKIGYYE